MMEEIAVTAEAVRKAFRESQKRHLFLMGEKGCGKSTLLKEIITQELTEAGQSQDDFPAFFPGIITEFYPRVRGEKRTLALGEAYIRMTDAMTGKSGVIGRYDFGKGRMSPVMEGFEKVGIPAIDRVLAGGKDSADALGFFVLDELGYLESGCPLFCKAVLRLLDHINIYGVIRNLDTPFLNQVKARADVFVYNCLQEGEAKWKE